MPQCHRHTIEDHLHIERETPYGAGRDGCEWDPVRGDLAVACDDHYLTVPATVIVGRAKTFRLCDECAALPVFRRYRVRRPIKKEARDATK